jgi:hypothetical protein
VSTSGRSLGELTIRDLAIELGPARAQIVQRRLGGLVIVTSTGVAAAVAASLLRAVLGLSVIVAAVHPAHHENHRERTRE